MPTPFAPRYPVPGPPRRLITVPLAALSLLLGAILFAPLLGIVSARALAQTTPVPVTPTFSATASIACDGIVDGSLSIAGVNATQAGPKVDLVFVLDESGSVASADFAAAKQAMINVVNGLAFGPDDFAVGVVAYDDSARTIISPTQNQGLVANAITNIRQGRGNTNTNAGLQAAQSLLNGGRQAATKIIITITDGNWNRGSDPAPLAADIQAQPSWFMFGVGVGAGISAANINALSSNPDATYAFPVPNYSALSTTLLDIAADITQPAATNLSYAMEPGTDFALVAGSAAASKGAFTPTTAGFSWDLDELATETVTITYQLRHTGDANGTKDIHASAALAWTEGASTPGSASYADQQVEVTGCDTTAPVLELPDDITAEATGPAGAAVTYTATATDNVDGTVPVDCTPASGSTFSLGTTTVDCSAEDAADNEGIGSFTVSVVDTTAPSLVDLPADISVEATGPDGAVATYTDPTATDLVDQDVDVACLPASGSTVALAATTVTCTATDDAGNDASVGFTVSVVDTTAPALSLPGDLATEATGPAGAIITFAASATDVVDGDVPVNCAPPSGATFPLRATTVACTATDNAGNAAAGSFAVTVVDTTAPTITAPHVVVEATSPAGAVVNYAAGVSAVDLVSGSVAVSCDLPSGATFPIGSTTVSCAATDAVGNATAQAFQVTVQTTLTPTNKDQCKHDGWRSFNNPFFRNQGDCVSFVATPR